MKIEITILGLLMESNLYGYEIKKKIVEKLEDYVDIKFGSIYYAIKKALKNGWVKRVDTKKDSGNPERYIYEILPVGKKQYKKLLKQFFEQNLIHFNIDIVLMFLNSMSPEQKKEFVEDRHQLISEKLESIKVKIDGEQGNQSETSNYFVLTYIKNHLSAELEWLNSIKSTLTVT